jgi:hypothetical protein
VPRGRRRAAPRTFLLAATVAGAALALSACSGAADGQSLARQACVHVHRSVSDYLLASRAGTSPSAVAHLQDEADQELRAALPLAAAANSDDGSWNSLMTTISEGAIVDEAHLIPSLTAQCVVADANTNVNPAAPGSSNSGNSSNSGGSHASGGSGGATTTVPQNVNPAPASPAG